MEKQNIAASRCFTAALERVENCNIAFQQPASVAQGIEIASQRVTIAFQKAAIASHPESCVMGFRVTAMDPEAIARGWLRHVFVVPRDIRVSGA